MFVVFSHVPSIVAPIGEDTVLDCGYRQRDTPIERNVGLEWRWQYRGQGRTILDMKETESGTLGEKKFVHVFPINKYDCRYCE